MRTYVLDGAIKNDSECWHGGACADCQGCDTLPIRVTPQWAARNLFRLSVQKATDPTYQRRASKNGLKLLAVGRAAL